MIIEDKAKMSNYNGEKDRSRKPTQRTVVHIGL